MVNKLITVTILLITSLSLYGSYSFPYYDEHGEFWGCLTLNENGDEVVEYAANPEDCRKWDWMNGGRQFTVYPVWVDGEFMGCQFFDCENNGHVIGIRGGRPILYPSTCHQLQESFQALMDAMGWDCMPTELINPNGILVGPRKGIGEAPEITWVYGKAAKLLAAEYLSKRHPDPKEFGELYISLGIDEVLAATPIKQGLLTIDMYGNKWVIETIK